MQHDPIADELAIRSLVASYTDAINRSDVDDIGPVYAEDGVLTMMERPDVVGRAAILDMLSATLARYQIVMQLVHSGIVQLDGDRARARWQITELQVTVEGESRFIAGRYEDDLVRHPHGWQFAHRTFTARYFGDLALSAPLQPDKPTLFALWPTGGATT